jgi:hypothetical protein
VQAINFNLASGLLLIVSALAAALIGAAASLLPTLRLAPAWATTL